MANFEHYWPDWATKPEVERIARMVAFVQAPRSFDPAAKSFVDNYWEKYLPYADIVLKTSRYMSRKSSES